MKSILFRLSEHEEEEVVVQTYYTEDTPHISKAPSMTDLRGCVGHNSQVPPAPEPKLASGLETPASEGPQEYADEGSDSFDEESGEETEKGQLEVRPTVWKFAKFSTTPILREINLKPSNFRLLRALQRRT